MKYGPYSVGTKIPDNALVGYSSHEGTLYAVVGDFSEHDSFVPEKTTKQNITAFGIVTTGVQAGSSVRSRVRQWSEI